jgi:hypothetical protein
MKVFCHFAVRQKHIVSSSFIALREGEADSGDLPRFTNVKEEKTISVIVWN